VPDSISMVHQSSSKVCDPLMMSPQCRVQQQPIQLNKHKHAAIRITATDS
jgi:hypothetical protein